MIFGSKPTLSHLHGGSTFLPSHGRLGFSDGYNQQDHQQELVGGCSKPTWCHLRAGNTSQTTRDKRPTWGHCKMQSLDVAALALVLDWVKLLCSTCQQRTYHPLAPKTSHQASPSLALKRIGHCCNHSIKSLSYLLPALYPIGCMFSPHDLLWHPGYKQLSLQHLHEHL